MALNYYYNFAIIDRESRLCIEVRSSTLDQSSSSNDVELYVQIPSYNEDYILKYYDESTGKWYHDEAMTDEWIPPQE